MTITITTQITPTFAQVGPFCTGANLAPLPTTSQNNISGTWSPALNNTATTTYTFTPNPNQCAVPTAMTIVVNNAVTPTFAQVELFCAGSAIPALPTTSQNNISGTWSPALNNQQTTTYTFTPGGNQCATTQTLTIQITPQTPPDFVQVGPFCQGTTIPALPTTSLNGITGTWSPELNNQQTTTYTFTPSAGQCASSTTTIVQVNTVDTTATSLTVCFGDFPFLWNGLNIASEGVYDIVLVNQFGCDSLVTLTVNELSFSTSTTNAVVCQNDLPFNWNGETYFSAGNYATVLVNSFGCDSTANLNLSVENFIQPTFTADVFEGCTPLTVTFQNNTLGEFSSCLWNFGDGQVDSICGAVDYTFETEDCFDISLSLTTVNGCIGFTTLEDLICVTATPIANFIANPSVVSTIEPLVNFVNTSVFADTYSWDFGDDSGNSSQESPFHIYPEEQGEYVVTLIAYNGTCTDTVFQMISIQSEPLFYVPNTFTPDGDLFNQSFLPIFTAGFDPYGYNLLIFNRWGEVLFESNNAAVGWDGTYGGEICQDGTYIWQITFKELGRDKRQIIRGHINLLR